jgi:Phosphodiester glycosidase
MRKHWIGGLILLVLVGLIGQHSTAQQSGSGSGSRSGARSGSRSGLSVAPAVFKIGSRRINATVLRASRAAFKLEVALAGNRVGDNATLGVILKRTRALCAINGTFLAAYKANGQNGEPYGTLAINGRWVYLGTTGTRLEINGSSLALVTDGLKIRGLVGNQGWYAYGINRTPTNASSIFVHTPERGAQIGYSADLVATVEAGVISKVEQNSNALIPPDGFVIAATGREAEMFSRRFVVGMPVSINVFDRNENPVSGVDFALGAGPRLLEDGVVRLDPNGEGFVSSKVISERNARSVVGWNASQIFLVTLNAATLREEAELMLQLGASFAMNLDGGASSGLVCSDRVWVQPGRELANALLIRAR